MNRLQSGMVGAGKVLMRAGRWLVTARGGAFSAVSRVSASVMSIVGIALAGVALTGMATAYANAPNPLPATTGTATVHPDGSVTISLNGTWEWPASGAQPCAGRYGEAWSVDWWGVSSSSTPNPNFTLSDATEVTSPATTTTGSVSPAGSIAYTPGGTFFHVGQYYTGEVVNNSTDCTDVTVTSSGGGGPGPGGGGGGTTTTSTGAWSASATYPSTSDVPADLCIILYDLHGSEGSPSGSYSAGQTGPGGGDFSPTGDNDNSIDTNVYDPAAGQGFCFGSSFVPSVSLVKTGPATGNANGTGTYTLTATNSGNALASNVAVTDTLPTGETFVSSSNSTCAATAGGSPLAGTSPGISQTVTCTIASIAPSGGTSSFTITVQYAADASGTLTDSATVTGQATPSCVPTVFQSITGHIYLCSSGSQTTNEVPGGTLSASGPQSISATSNPLSEGGVASGAYTMDASAPSGYDFTSCAGSATIGSPPTTATESVTVPSGGTGNGVFYVTPVTQALLGHIYLCSAGSPTTTEVSGGTISASGPQSIAAAPNPLSNSSVASGTYTMGASAPSGYDFTACGGTATISTPTSATESVTVPSGGTGTGIFYVTPVAAPTQSLTGHIYLCSSGSETTNEVAGGSLSASGPQTIASTPNPLSNSNVASGAYTMDATAPSGYDFTSCGGSATVGSPPTSATESVTVPSGGTGNGVFYVTPITQSLIGHIYQCSSTGSATTTEVPGGTLSASGPQTVAAAPNPLSDGSVASGSYTMTAGAPSGYEFTSCGGSATIGTPTSATETVTVPSGGTGTGIFYVVPIPPNTPNITLGVTKANDANGSGTYSQTETASAPGENVPFQVVVTNTSSVPVTITSLTDSWPSETPFSPTCASAVVGETLSAGASVTCDFTVDNYAPAAGSSLTNTATVTGCQASNTTNCATVPATSTVVSPPGGPGAPEPVSVAIAKGNDANGSGTYSQSQTATGAGENVPFQVVVTNNSSFPVTVTSLTDAWPSEAPFSPSCASAVVGQTLAAGASATCDFTVDDYAPAAGDALTDTATVTACQASLTTNCSSEPATSTVNTPPPASPPAPPVTKAASTPLPFTGAPAHLQLLLEVGFGLMSLGFFLIWYTRPRRAVARRR